MLYLPFQRGAVVDSVVGVLSIAWAAVSQGVGSIRVEDAVALLAAFAVGAATPIVRDRVLNWITRYINRFVRRGLKQIAANYAFSLAAIVFASAVAFIELRAYLPHFVQGAILGAAITAAVALTVMGWQARGPSSTTRHGVCSDIL